MTCRWQRLASRPGVASFQLGRGRRAAGARPARDELSTGCRRSVEDLPAGGLVGGRPNLVIDDEDRRVDRALRRRSPGSRRPPPCGRGRLRTGCDCRPDRRGRRRHTLSPPPKNRTVSRLRSGRLSDDHEWSIWLIWLILADLADSGLDPRGRERLVSQDGDECSVLRRPVNISCSSPDADAAAKAAARVLRALAPSIRSSRTIHNISSHGEISRAMLSA